LASRKEGVSFKQFFTFDSTTIRLFSEVLKGVGRKLKGNGGQKGGMNTSNSSYYYCVGAFGYIPGYKEGFLRIKKGETEFDERYYFPIADKTLNGVPDNAASYAYQKVYAGNGKVYGGV
jgi:hypothetical protein